MMKRMMKRWISHSAQFYLCGLLALTACGEKGETARVADTALPTPPSTASARPVHWTYSGEDGPESWARLSPAYALCGSGKSQSPVALTSGSATKGTSVSLNYGTTKLTVAHHEHVDDIIDNGHTIQVIVREGSTLTFDGKSYALKQFHVHTPSEHTLDGKSLPMEVHFVHQDSAGNLAVVGVLVTEGAPNENFAKLGTHLPAKGDTVIVHGDELDLTMQLPAREKAYHYVGSLTTPPCSENVQWLVLQDMITLSKEQIAAVSSRIGQNNRPTQPLNERKVDVRGMSDTVR